MLKTPKYTVIECKRLAKIYIGSIIDCPKLKSMSSTIIKATISKSACNTYYARTLKVYNIVILF